MLRESWVPVVGYEGRYEVSSLGRVRSTVGESARIRKLQTRPSGHLGVDLKKHGSRRTFLVHRLVAIAFLGEPDPGQEVRHLNGVANDNRVENLAWGTRSENMFDRVTHGVHQYASMTSCSRGHPLSGRNLQFRSNSAGRVCRSCAATRAWFAYYPHVDRDMFDDIAATYLWKFSAEKEAAA